MARLTKAALQEQYDELNDALAESHNQIDVLEADRQALQQHRDEIYEVLDEYEQEIRDLRADVAGLTNAAVEALTELEEANEDADAYSRMVEFYMRALHAISTYGGSEVAVPVGIAQATIGSNLISVNVDSETRKVSNV